MRNSYCKISNAYLKVELNKLSKQRFQFILIILEIIEICQMPASIKKHCIEVMPFNQVAATKTLA